MKHGELIKKNKQLFAKMKVVREGASYRFDDVFVCQRSFPHSYRGMWLKAFHPPLKWHMKVLDVCGEVGWWGAYLQLVYGFRFNYTVLDAGVYLKTLFKKQEPYPTPLTSDYDFKPIWSLLYNGETLKEKATLPEILRTGVKTFFRELGVKGNFVLHKIEEDAEMPFKENVFDQIWMFGWWAWPLPEEHLFKDVKRVLKPDGYFLFDMPSKQYHLERGGRKMPYSYKTKQELIEFLKKTRLTKKRVDEIPTPWRAPYKKTWGVIAQ